MCRDLRLFLTLDSTRSRNRISSVLQRQTIVYRKDSISWAISVWAFAVAINAVKDFPVEAAFGFETSLPASTLLPSETSQVESELVSPSESVSVKLGFPSGGISSSNGCLLPAMRDVTARGRISDRVPPRSRRSRTGRSYFCQSGPTRRCVRKLQTGINNYLCEASEDLTVLHIDSRSRMT